MSRSDRTLIARARRGDARAFAELFDRHAPSVYRYSISQMRSVSDAQDVTQQTFITAWEKLDSVTLASDSFLPWLLTVSRNHARNALRARRRRADAEGSLAAQAHSVPGADVAADERLALAAVLRRLRSLPHDDQRLVRLCLIEGMTYEDAGREIGIPRATAAKRVQRIRARLSRRDGRL